jgi:hypothetical protein
VPYAIQQDDLYRSSHWQPDGAQHVIPRVDDGVDGQRGLAVEVWPSGVKTYRAYYYLGGSSNARSITLGRYREMSLEKARERTAEIRGNGKAGVDPREAEATKPKTFGELAENVGQSSAAIPRRADMDGIRSQCYRSQEP